MLQNKIKKMTRSPESAILIHVGHRRLTGEEASMDTCYQCDGVYETSQVTWDLDLDELRCNIPNLLNRKVKEFFVSRSLAPEGRLKNQAILNIVVEDIPLTGLYYIERCFITEQGDCISYGQGAFEGRFFSSERAAKKFARWEDYLLDKEHSQVFIICKVEEE